MGMTSHGVRRREDQRSEEGKRPVFCYGPTVNCPLQGRFIPHWWLSLGILWLRRGASGEAGHWGGD